MTSSEFKACRKAKGLSQKDLATFLGAGASYSAVTKWESGANPVPAWVASRMQGDIRDIKVKDLSASQLSDFERKSAKLGKTPDQMAAHLIKIFLGSAVFVALLWHQVPKSRPVLRFCAHAIGSAVESGIKSLAKL